MDSVPDSGIPARKEEVTHHGSSAENKPASASDPIVRDRTHGGLNGYAAGTSASESESSLTLKSTPPEGSSPFPSHDANANSKTHGDSITNGINGPCPTREESLIKVDNNERERESSKIASPFATNHNPTEGQSRNPHDKPSDENPILMRVSARDLQERIQIERTRLKNKREQLHQLRIETTEEKHGQLLKEDSLSQQMHPPVDPLANPYGESSMEPMTPIPRDSVPDTIVISRKDDMSSQAREVSKSTDNTNVANAKKKKNVTKSRCSMSQQSRNRAIKWGVLITFLIVIVVTLVLVDRQQEQAAQQQKDNQSSNSTPTSADLDGDGVPCDQETNLIPDCVCQEEFAQPLSIEVAHNRNLILEYLISVGVVDNSTIATLNVNSQSCDVRNQALVWVSNLENHPADSPPTNLQLLQRYILAVFYQQLGGNGWTSTNGSWMAGAASECDWDGIECSSTTESIMELNLEGENLRGSLPSLEIGKLDSLRQLNLAQNPSLLGTLPSDITKLPLLQSLFLSSTSLSGNLPTEFGMRFAELSASFAKFGGSLPTELGLLTRLRILDLSHNSFQGQLITELLLLPALEVFDVSFNNFTGTLPTNNWKCPYLDVFNINDNPGLDGPYPEPASSMLTTINLAHTALTGTVPTAYCELVYLESLVVDCENGSSSSSPIPCSCCQCLES